MVSSHPSSQLNKRQPFGVPGDVVEMNTYDDRHTVELAYCDSGICGAQVKAQFPHVHLIKLVCAKYCHAEFWVAFDHGTFPRPRDIGQLLQYWNSATCTI